MTERIAYKILTAREAEALANRRFAGSPLDLADGYMHLSSAAQVQGTLDRHFAGHTDLMLAAIDLTVLGDAIRWEESRDGALFPHLYGPLPADAVIAVEPVRRDEQGRVELPNQRGDE